MFMDTISKSSPTPAFRCSTVAILGRPNAGKSTLLNALIESDLSATSDRPQTTRSNVKGILQRYNEKKEWIAQHVLVDTPGVNLKKGLLDRSMYTAIEDAMRDVDIAVWVADSRTFERDLDDVAMGRSGQEDRLALWLRDQIRRPGQKTQWLLVLSKADLVNKAELLPLIEKASQVLPEFVEIIPVSAMQGLADSRSNLDGFLKILDRIAPEGDALYPEEAWTDLSGREVLRNLVREAIFRGSYKEIPYECDCFIESWVDAEPGRRTEVHATICVSRESIKRILVGKGGSKIKEIGINVRKRYLDLTGDEIILKLFVKVIEKWNQMPQHMHQLGYEAN
jgi:GTP-binding protein Era